MSEPIHVRVRKFLQEFFNDEELTTFSFDYFPQVYNNFTNGMTKNQKIIMLVEFSFKSNRFDELLRALERERSSAFMKNFSENKNSNNLQDLYASTAEETRTGSNKERLNSFIHPITGKEMVRVSKGEFLYGDFKETIYLEEFWIDKTPVTNAEFKLFLDENPDHHVPSAWYGSLGKLIGQSGYEWDDSLRMFPAGKANHPVVLVDWYSAKAYAEWSSGDLPTELQWEKAARGTDGRKYPWGDEWLENNCYTPVFFNVTTSVGRFSPQGDSPYGCVDMVGNVLEWTRSEIRRITKRRVTRGGFLGNIAKLARISARDGAIPSFRHNSLGFRTVVNHPLIYSHSGLDLSDLK
ncbi:MAG: SUMF1/EgtB/PvdO family nonheme iron enzyme [Ardenticatenaceae bacterium]|nr:SUMF1/EgtB/PvdO family nonheme iron enzyme [Ardenticatenaceae bacterium]